MVNLFDALARRVAVDGEQTAITEGDGTTYQQLFNRACRIGWELQSSGIRETETIGILADHGRPMLSTITDSGRPPAFVAPD